VNTPAQPENPPDPLVPQAHATTRFPCIPVAAFAVVALSVAAVLIGPPCYRRYVTEPDLAPQGQTPTWVGFAFKGQCLLTAQIIPERSRAGVHFPDYPADQIFVLVTINNSRSERPLQFTRAGARFYTYRGRSIPSGHAAEDSAITSTIEPHSLPREFALLFPRAPVLESMERLYALQLRLDGEACNIPGLYYPSDAEATSARLHIDANLELLPPAGDNASPSPADGTSGDSTE